MRASSSASRLLAFLQRLGWKQHHARAFCIVEGTSVELCAFGSAFLCPTIPSLNQRKKREARNEKREARSEKQEARNKKREARNERETPAHVCSFFFHTCISSCNMGSMFENSIVNVNVITIAIANLFIGISFTFVA